MSWHRRLPVTDNEIDRGDLHLEGVTIENMRFDCCGVSVSKERRSRFVNCAFRNLRFHRCSMGSPVFEGCSFENLWASEGHSAHGALFLECKCSGTIKGIDFG